MIQDSLDRQVERYYRNQRLSPEALRNLKATVNGERERISSRRNRRWLHIALAASLAGILILGIVFGVGLLGNSDNPRITSTDLTARVASEAAICHNQNYDVEFEATDYIDLRAKMDRLDFQPVEPDRLHGQGMELIGARYTMLRGRPAVQLVFEGPEGQICSLYQARPVSDLAALTSASHQIDGLDIDIWQEKGLVMILARPVT